MLTVIKYRRVFSVALAPHEKVRCMVPVLLSRVLQGEGR